MTPDLFDALPQEPSDEAIAPGAVVLRAFARDMDTVLLRAIDAVTARSPLHHMQTPGGYTMSVASTSCGPLGWVSSPDGYRYAAHDPRTDQPWPAMPAWFVDLARRAAAQAGYDNFVPDACLINEYLPGAKLSLHQDKDEKDLRAPIVSVSLGLAAVFLFGTTQRSGPTQRYRLVHGDVVVWGGPSRLAFHAVMPLADGVHALLGRRRVNVTFRRVRPA
ncbi:MAG: DNA oxidative demethylase AlkB [Ferruginibacter sp.]|nr:DNA oxidative demethylase AlkB [Rhodoferax sp.]